MMDFDNITNLKIFREKNSPILHDLYDLNNNKDVEPAIKLFIEKGHYSLSIVKSLMNHPRVFNHLYYQLGREFVFNNLTIVLLLIINCFMPYIISNYYSNTINVHFWIYQSLQPIISVFYLLFSFIFLKKYVVFKSNDNRKEISEGGTVKVLKSYFSLIKNLKVPYSFFTLCALFFIISVFLFSLTLYFKSPFLIFVAINFFLFPIILAMIFKGFQEYEHVEKYCWAYLIEKHFLKFTKEINKTNK